MENFRNSKKNSLKSIVKKSPYGDFLSDSDSDNIVAGFARPILWIRTTILNVRFAFTKVAKQLLSFPRRRE